MKINTKKLIRSLENRIFDYQMEMRDDNISICDLQAIYYFKQESMRILEMIKMAEYDENYSNKLLDSAKDIEESET